MTSKLLQHAGLALGFLLAGCTLGPDFHAPAPPPVTGYTKQPLPAQTESAPVQGGEAQHFSSGSDIPGQWWALFHSEALNSLVEDAIRSNPTLPAAQAALRSAMESVRAQQGLFYPQVSANLSANTNRQSAALSPVLNNNALFYSLYQADLNASWTPDIFGNNRRQVEVLQSQAEAQRDQLDAAYLALTANVVAGAIQEASLRGQIDGTQQVIQSIEDALTIMRRQMALGQISGGEVAAEEAALAQAQQILPPLEKQLALERDLLTELAGRLPSDEVDQSFDLSALQLPQDLPLSLPSKLVEQRPDIRLAEANLHAANAEIGVAVTNMFPQITISADIGTVASRIGDLVQPGNAFWSIGGSLLQPVFEGGRLKHLTRAAEAAYDQSAANYRNTVLTAFQNVADTLHALQSDAELLKAASATEAAALRSLDIARRQLELGQIQYLGLLTAQQTYEQALITRIQAQASRFADTAALFQALGGGWWNSQAVVEAAYPAAPVNGRH
ncbi:MAG: efflux transporter outer membrane subunit [Alphaproteobacteria bacterium]|nr:efflux transporter outer membrane subunit [Alphaproteobacteria bacterium]